MWNARPCYENFGGEWVEVTTLPDGREENTRERSWSDENEQIFREQLKGRLNSVDYKLAYVATKRTGETHTKTSKGKMFTAELAPSEMISLLEQFRFRERDENPDPAHARLIEFLKGSDKRDPKIDRWMVILPQIARGQTKRKWKCGKELRVFERNRVTTDRSDGVSQPFKAFSEERHRRIAEYLANDLAADHEASIELVKLRKPHTAVLLLYPCLEKESDSDVKVPVSMGHAIHCPPNPIPQKLVFEVRDKSKPDDVAVLNDRSEV